MHKAQPQVVRYHKVKQQRVNRNGVENRDKVKAVIDDYWRKKCAPPSVREVCDGSGIDSLSHVLQIMDALEWSGYLLPRKQGIARQITPKWVSEAIKKFDTVEKV